ncbi:MAG: NAD-dependent epimerase/dehydratase family protein, partial [Hyphomonadaceae bacterium]
MTILVTGGAGYIGAQMSHALVDSGLIPIVLDDLSTGARENVPQTAIFVEGDIGDAALLSTLMQRHRIRAVMHFAAKTVVSESATRPLEHYLTNTCKTRTLIEAAVDAGVPHFIFSSTASVYGEPVRAPIPDDDVCLPISPYGWSKLMAEQILADAAAAHDL